MKKIARTVVAVACSASLVCSFVPAAALAADAGAVGEVFAQGGLTFKVTGQGEVSLGDGSVAGAADTSVTGTQVRIPASVSYGGAEYAVTSIASYALWNDTSLRSVTIPATVKSIGSYAFSGDGTMDESGAVPVYGGLERVSLEPGSQLRFIGEKAFYNCYNLESFTLPANLQSLGLWSFGNCFSFKTLEFEPGAQITAIGDRAFEVEWQEGFVKPQGWNIDAHYNSFSTLIIPIENQNDYVTYDFASANAASKVYGGLEKVVLPPSVQTVGLKAFANQRCLTSVTFQASQLRQIGSFAFGFCSALEQITIPGGGYVLPGDTAEQNPYDDFVFSGCTKLRTVIFDGHIMGAASDWAGYRMFDGCPQLGEVAFTYERFAPVSSYHKDAGGSPVMDTYGFNGVEPTLYFKVGFAASKAQAAAGGDALGWAVLREGTQASAVRAGMAATDADGAVVLEGSVPALPAGYDAWALVGRGGSRAYAANEGIEDVCFAYPVKSADLSFGGVQLVQDAFWCDGAEHAPDVAVVDAAGRVLGSGEYALSWERLGAGGAWEPTADLSSAGSLRAVASGLGAYSGTAYGRFEIAYLEAGAVFESGGVTYAVSRAQSAGAPAELQVGDGEHLAVDAATSGAVEVPAAVAVGGMELAVTSVAAGAFGSAEGQSCAAVTEVVLPEGVEAVGDYAFAGMASLERAALPASLRSVGTGAFSRCPQLASVEFAGSSVERIGTSAFAYCTKLKSVELPAITGSFLGLAFQGCVMLSSVAFRGKVAGEALGQFDGCTRLSTVAYRGAWWAYPWAKGTAVTATAGSGASKALYAVVIGKKAAAYASCLAPGTSATVPASVKLGGASYSVAGIAAGAFKASKAKTVAVKTTKLTKASVKNSLKGSKVTAVKAPKSKLAAYARAFAKPNSGKKVTVS